MENIKARRKKKAIEVSLPQQVALVYSDVQRSYFLTEALYITEKDAQVDAARIAAFLEALGISTRLYPGDNELATKLHRDRPELVINLVDSVKGAESLASAIPGVLELLEIPYTGAGILGLSLDTNKFLGCKLLQQNGVPVPYFQLFNTSKDPLDPLLRFPLISKLNAVHGSVEISQDAISENEKQLRKRLKYLIGTYQQPVLVEEYISGREITAIVLQDKKKKVFLAEKVFIHPENKYLLLTFEDQWLLGSASTFRYRKYSNRQLNDTVKKAFEVAKMGGYGKFDIRLDQSGRYFFIDANCNPSLGPIEQEAALSVILDKYGISFEEFLRRLLLNTLRAAAKKARPIQTLVEKDLPELPAESVLVPAAQAQSELPQPAEALPPHFPEPEPPPL